MGIISSHCEWKIAGEFPEGVHCIGQVQTRYLVVRIERCGHDAAFARRTVSPGNGRSANSYTLQGAGARDAGSCWRSDFRCVLRCWLVKAVHYVRQAQGVGRVVAKTV